MREAAVETAVVPEGRRGFGWRTPLLAVALVIGMVGRISYSWSAPFWFDETFSGVIASQPDFARLLHWCLTELTGPAYYMPLWAWAKLVGPSDAMLRLPSLILSIVTPLLILWRGHHDRDLRLFWTIVCLLWAPFLSVAGEARAYPQLFALGAIQAMLFVRLVARPSTAGASWWMLASVLLTLTNYWGVVPCVVQGVAYIAVHHRQAPRTWPALLVALPLLGWAYWHLPVVLGFTIGHSDQGLPLSAIAEIPAILFGVTLGGSIIIVTILASSLMVGRRDRRIVRVSPEYILAWCGVASVALVILLAFLRPGFASRYITPAMPSLLFGLALWIRWMLGRDAKPVLIVLAMMIVTAVGVSVSARTRGDVRHVFNLEQPSAWLGERAPSRLVVFWDGPVAEKTPAAPIAEVGGFFLRRAGHAVAVTVARAGPGQDPNHQIAALARSEPVAAVIWMSNDELPANRNPALERYDSSLECRDFGGGQVTMTACRRRN